MKQGKDINQMRTIITSTQWGCKNLQRNKSHWHWILRVSQVFLELYSFVMEVKQEWGTLIWETLWLSNVQFMMRFVCPSSSLCLNSSFIWTPQNAICNVAPNTAAHTANQAVVSVSHYILCMSFFTPFFFVETGIHPKQPCKSYYSTPDFSAMVAMTTANFISGSFWNGVRSEIPNVM